MEDQKKPSPMYFASLEVENVKSFGGKQILDLRDSEGVLSPWTLILGDNGVGKTTLLKCLAWMVPVKFPEDPRVQAAKQLKKTKEFEDDLIKKVTKVSDKEWGMILREYSSTEKEIKRMKPLMDNFENEVDFNAIIRVGKGVKMSIAAQFTYGVTLNTIPNQEDLMTIGISLAKKDDEKVDEIEDIINTDHLKTAEVKEFITPNLFAYGAARHMETENFEKPELKESTYNLFSNSGDLYDAEEVLLKLYTDSLEEQNIMMKETIELQKSGSTQMSTNEAQNESVITKPKGKATKHLQKVKEILAELLPHIDNSDCIVINQSKKKEGLANDRIVEVRTPFGQVGLYDLSLGYQTMLAWVVDLAIRMFWQNPDSDKPLEEPAVVIVDEIDLHLHPKWQRTIKEYLTGNFTATQFICTAHSPFMAQASEDENLCVLNQVGNEVKIENTPYIVKGWRIGQIVTSDLFGVKNERKIEIEHFENERRRLLDKKELSIVEKQRLKYLDEEYLKLPILENDEDQKLLDSIRKAAELLRKEDEIE